MGILVRDAKIDRMVRELAERDGITLQAAIGLAVERELARREERRRRVDAAFARIHERFADHPVMDDGMTHKEFFDRESGEI